MSVIFGYIHLSDRSIEIETLEMMKRAMNSWGPDGESLWGERNCGLGNLLYYNTPEALYENQPLQSSTGDVVLVAGARIDNRDELFNIFDIPLGQRLTMPDSVLMLKAYEKWGEACPDHLVGDWAMAVWDKRDQKLFLARDHHGISALYYYKGENFFVFSSSLKGILCLPDVPKKVNDYKIAQLLVNWNEGGPTTCYLDIMRLPPAHSLTLQAGKLTTNRYWYLEHTPEVRLKNDQEYADMFLHLYTEAVKCRLRSHRPVGATLSSGLDSGSVCILAAKELAKEGKRLPAYTAVPLYDTTGLLPPNRIGDEGPYALALSKKLGNVDVTLCRAEEISVLQGIERKLLVHDQPNFALSNAYWLTDLFIKANGRNVGTLLIGQNGNATVSWPPSSLLNERNDTISSKLSKYKQWLKLKTGYWKRNIILKDSLISNLITKGLLNEVLIFPYRLKNRNLKDIRLQMILPGRNSIGDLWFESGTFYKLEVRDPTIDLALQKFLLGTYGFSSRNFFESCFKDYFPSSIINGLETGVQAVDIIKRLERELKVIESYLLELDESKYFYAHYVSYKKITKLLRKTHDRGDVRFLLRAYLIKSFIHKNIS